MSRRNASTTKEREFTKIDNFKIVRAITFDSGDTLASVCLNGITIHNVRIMETKDSSHEFLAMPSRKGNDGKYYPYVSVSLSDEDTVKIIDAIDDYLDKKDGK